MGKRFQKASETYDKAVLHTVEDAVKIVKKNAVAKFDETIELHLRLGLDTRQADQQLRTTILLPNGTGKKVRVAVIAKGDQVNDAKEAGADIVGGLELMEEIKTGKIDFDVLVATPDVMKDLSKVAKILGPKGLMPNPKSGTVTFEVGRAVKEIKAGRVEFKADAYGIVHVPVGKASFTEVQIAENAKTIIDEVIRLKPSSAKGVYMRSISMSSTMGPGVYILTQAPVAAK